ncbi:MAG: Rpn family recombination-promoting nuclease/putative transposase [Planctomycetales bacterium]
MPTVDFAFKLMLGSPDHTRVTVHFLNALLGDFLRITQVTILNPILGKEFADDKLSVLDILAEDEHGRKFNIEMQTSMSSELSQRLAYYLSGVYSSQLTEGLDYSALRPAISICVLTRSMFPDDPRLHLDFRMRESSGLILTNDLQIHLLELQKLQVLAENVRQATTIERWAFFLMNAHLLSQNEMSRIFPDQEILEAAGVLVMISKSPREQQFYDARLKFQRDEATRQAAARRQADEAERAIESARANALLEGRAEGRAEGLREGKSQGIERGQLLGRIALLQELLGVAEPAPGDISNDDDQRLSELAGELQVRLRSRGT